jgi:hypothetical protein
VGQRIDDQIRATVEQLHRLVAAQCPAVGRGQPAKAAPRSRSSTMTPAYATASRGMSLNTQPSASRASAAAGLSSPLPM